MALQLLSGVIRTGAGLSVHNIRVSATFITATGSFGATLDPISGSFAGTYRPVANAQLSATLAPVSAFFQAQKGAFTSAPLLHGPIRDSTGQMLRHGIRTYLGWQASFAPTLANIVGLFSGTRTVPTRTAAFSAFVDMIGPMKGSASVDDGFSAQFAGPLANVVASFQGTSGIPGVFLAGISARLDDMAGSFAGTFKSKSNAVIAATLDDIAGAFTGAVVNVSQTAQFTIQLDAISAAFAGHVQLPGISAAAFAARLDDIVGAFSGGASFAIYTADFFGVQLADVRCQFFGLQADVPPTWPGDSHVVGLPVARKNFPLLVHPT